MRRPDKRRSGGYLPPHQGAPLIGPEFPVRVERDVYPRPEYRAPLYRTTVSVDGPVTAPDGSPNVLVVVLGDVGYGVLSTFGGLVESPTLDRLARGGLRYCRFHSAGIGAATRSMMLTGRNHRSSVPRGCATVAELLRQNGYATGWWGRCSTVPTPHTSAAGPFDRWPTSLGFDHFYGTMGDESDQFQPPLFRNSTVVDPPRTPEQGYHLTADLASDCVVWLRQQKAIAPDRPLFAYFAAPSGRAPHQPPLDRRGRHARKFDFGWEEYRRRVYERQLELGVIPRDTLLSQRPAPIPAWSTNPDDQRLFANFFENYADYVEHADAEIGRIIDALDEMSELENTLVLYVADSGCNGEGTPAGTLNLRYALDGNDLLAEHHRPSVDEIGKPGTSPHMPTGWAWAGNTPFSWVSPVASHLGATRAPLVIHWPRRIPAAGGLRNQFHHAVDIAPTILEVVGIHQPSMVNGISQRPIDGMSMAYTFSADRAGVESVRTVQHFEGAGTRAVYADGWLACARDGHIPWTTATPSIDDKGWELYRIADDFSASANLAPQDPKRLRVLQDLFLSEASRYDASPFDEAAKGRDHGVSSPWLRGRRRVSLFPGMVRVPERCACAQPNATHTITASLGVPRGGAEGVIVCAGSDAGGWSLYVLNRRLVYHYNFFNVERTEAVSDRELPVGDIDVAVRFASETSAPGGPANVELLIDAQVVGRARIARQVRSCFGHEGVDVGIDKCSPVSRAYRDRRGFPFTGTIARVTLELDGLRAELGALDRRGIHPGVIPTAARNPGQRKPS
jgi:arylsulfatase A-like enzyme